MAAEISIAHIAAHNLKPRMTHIVEPPPVVKRVIHAQSPHIITFSKQLFCQMRPDKSIGSRHKYLLVTHKKNALLVSSCKITTFQPNKHFFHTI